MVVVEKRDLMTPARRAVARGASATGVRQQQLLGIESDDEWEAGKTGTNTQHRVRNIVGVSHSEAKHDGSRRLQNGQTTRNQPPTQRKARVRSSDEEEDMFERSGQYTQEALKAVGRGLSPSTAAKLPRPPAVSAAHLRRDKLTPPKVENSETFQQRERQLSNQATRSHSGSATPTSAFLRLESSSYHSPPSSNSSAPDIVSIRVVRAWDLPECLGGTNAYVVFDWGKWGKATTQAISNTTEPCFGATLQFKSPYLPVDDGAAVRGSYGAMLSTLQYGQLLSRAGPMKVLVYHRNQSVSDELLGYGEIDVHEQLLLSLGADQNQVHQRSHDQRPIDVHDAVVERTSVLYLSGPTKRAAGSIEFFIRLMA